VEVRVSIMRLTMTVIITKTRSEDGDNSFHVDRLYIDVSCKP